MSVDSTDLEETIEGLMVYRNYTVVVQALGISGGDLTAEVIALTHSTPPPTPPTPRPTDIPLPPVTTVTIPVLIPDPREIDTGRVM